MMMIRSVDEDYDDDDVDDDDDQGWRKLDPGTGDEAGTTEGAFHLWSSSSTSSLSSSSPPTSLLSSSLTLSASSLTS